MSQPNMRGSAPPTPDAPTLTLYRSNTTPTEAEVVAALMDSAPLLGETPLVTRVVVYPVLATSVAMLELTGAMARSSLSIGRRLFDRAVKTLGWE